MPIKKSFSPEAKAEALEMLANGSTLKQTSEHIGCSVATLQTWKKSTKTGKKAKAAKKTAKKSEKVAEHVEPQPAECDAASFESFIREYWCQENRGKELLKSKPLEGFDLFFRINEALQYAYDHLNR